ncbi:MAG: hypothetical protein LBN08_02440 [Lactobacillales bacterium]|jgi:hypothetical protein|nr:hypothetical protein [Lactobacillales bacterium]
MKKFALAAVAALTLLSIAGCGSSSKDAKGDVEVYITRLSDKPNDKGARFTYNSKQYPTLIDGLRSKFDVKEKDGQIVSINGYHVSKHWKVDEYGGNINASIEDLIIEPGDNFVISPS